MKNKLSILVLLFLFFGSVSFSQWPGYFYAFGLKDSVGNIIDSTNKSCTMKTIPCGNCNGLVLGIKICEGNTIWHYFAGGNTNLDKTNFLQIIKKDNNSASDTMTIEFPPTLSGGKEKFYRDLYIGDVIFRKGTYKVILPKSDDEWDNLPELKEKICRLSYAVSLYYDISKFQK